MFEVLSYSPLEVSQLLKVSKGTVYELIRRGELPSYRVGKKIRVSQSDLEAYLGSGSSRGDVGNDGQLIICGQDVVLDVLGRYLERSGSSVRVLRSYVGSIDGLLLLYKKQAGITAAHLWDHESGDFNVPYVRRLLPGQRTVVVNLVYRMQGFYVAPGNPKGIKDWSDLSRAGVVLVNREPGCGARVSLDEHLLMLGIDGSSIDGYDREESSHVAVASSVARGVADVGVGIEKAALQVPGVEFVPLMKERYDLVLYRDGAGGSNLSSLLSVLRSPLFRAEVEGLGGYDISRMGEIVAEL